MSKHEAKEDLASNFATAFPALFPLSGPVTNIISRAAESYTQASLEWQEELVTFVSARLRSDLDLNKSIAESKSFADVLKLQQEWAAAALRVYFDETGKLTEIAHRAVRTGVASLYEAEPTTSAQPGGKAKPAAAIAAE